jgi:hypothetical protein
MSDEKETKAKGTLLVNRGKSVFHIKPTVELDKDGKPTEKVTSPARDIQPGEAFHADDDEQAEALLNYHAIGEATEDDPRIQAEIDHHKAEIERLEAEQKEQKKPIEVKKEEQEKAAPKETAKERELRKRHHRSR